MNPVSDDQEFEARHDPDSRRTPVRVAFVTRRTSPHVRPTGDEQLMTNPEALLRVAVAVLALTIALVATSLFWDAPLEGLADPLHTPNPAKAPWYFLGLQELLHYFPPVVGGVLVPAMVIVALIVIPYFGINIQAGGFWTTGRARKLRLVGVVTIALSVFLTWFRVWDVLVPTLAFALALWFARSEPGPSARFRIWLHSKPLPFWIMSWFLVVAVTLTVIGTFFRGAGWAFVWPWNTGGA
jgi:hypothetical protein